MCLERQLHKVAVRLCAALKLTEKIKLLEFEVSSARQLAAPMSGRICGSQVQWFSGTVCLTVGREIPRLNSTASGCVYRANLRESAALQQTATLS